MTSNFFGVLGQGITNIWWGLSPEQFQKHYNKPDFGIKNIQLLSSGKLRIEFMKKRDPLVLNKNQIERLTRRNTKVLFDKLENGSKISINGIDTDGKKTDGYLSENADFLRYVPLKNASEYVNFETVITEQGNETYLILKPLETIPSSFKKVPYDYNEVRNLSAGKRKTRHNRKYKNKKTKKTKKSRK